MTLSSNLRAILYVAAGLGLAVAIAGPTSANIVNPTCPKNVVIPGGYHPGTNSSFCKCPAGTGPEFLQPNSFECTALGQHVVQARDPRLNAKERVPMTGQCTAGKTCPKTDKTNGKVIPK